MKEAAGPSADAMVAGGEEAGGDVPAGAAYRIELPEFEGPLDLLLHLCKTHELDILNIPIAFVAEKYVEYLETMQAMSVEIAAEYLVMAATLAYLKARELVPDPEPLEGQGEDGEEALDPREELIRRLLEYQKYKDVAVQIGDRPVEGRNVFRRGVKPGAHQRSGRAGRTFGLEADRVVRRSAAQVGHEDHPRRGGRPGLAERPDQPDHRPAGGGLGQLPLRCAGRPVACPRPTCATSWW